jgi:glycosyltransferase involved in cell wall biosynthesis
VPARRAEGGGVLLSAIVPSYNHARYLPQALDALLAQSRPADEIIIVDDASTDDSHDVMSAYQARHPNIILLFNDHNQGALRTLQRGLDASQGRYVYFAAADDYVLPGLFDEAVAMLEACPQSGLFCAETRLVDGETGAAVGIRPIVRPLRRAGYLDPDGVERLLRRADHFIHTGSSVFRRAAVMEKGGFDPALGSFADGILARRIALGHGLCFSPSEAAAWVIHTSGISRATALDRESARAALENIPAMLAAAPDIPAWYPAAFARRWRFATARLALEAHPIDRGLLVDMAGVSRFDRAALALLSPFLPFRLGRLATLGWLSLRLRPFRLSDVLRTVLDRASERRASR